MGEPQQRVFDDSGMTQEFVAPWQRAAAKYPTAAAKVPAIRVNPALRRAKLWAQIAPDGALEINPDAAGRSDLDAIFAHELAHAAGANETQAQKAEKGSVAEQSDPVADLLKRSPLSNAQRAELWDAFQAAPDAETFAETLKPLRVNDAIKASLWDLKQQTAPEVETETPTPEPTTPEATPERSWGDTAKDVGIGMVKGAANTALDAGALVRRIPGVGAATNAIGNAIGGAVGRAVYGTAAEPVTSDAAFEQARESTTYANTPQRVGGAIETVAELAVPVAKGTKAAVSALPSTARAGAKFEQVMSKAATLPVDTQASGQVALRINELAERGGSMPMAVRKYLNRVTDPEKAQLTYEEARDFASNISRLSANEFGRLTPVVAREVANLRVTLNKEIAGAAIRAGKGKEYAQAMTEYAKAMKLRGYFESAVQGAKRNLPWASVAGGTYYGMQKLKQLLGE